MQAIIDKDNSRHFGSSPEDPGPLATDLSPTLTPAAIDQAMRKVADWELATNQPYFDQIWTSSVLYTGFMAASRSTGDPKYRDAMLATAKRFDWQLRNHLPNADDQAIGSTYLELYHLQPRSDRDPHWIAPLRTELDAVYPLKTLKPGDDRIPWWWCDALFMAPAVWAQMAATTGDHKYIDYLNTNWQLTSNLLYNQQEHLYARDATYIAKTEPNGKPIFWSRGEGWVMAGIARTLDSLPKDDPHRPFYINQLREMAARVAQLQDPDGSLARRPAGPRTLPSSRDLRLVTLHLRHRLGHQQQRPRSRRSTAQSLNMRGTASCAHIYADGRLGCIQQTGAEPAFYRPSACYDYGIGAFLLAGSELQTMVAHKSTHKK